MPPGVLECFLEGEVGQEFLEDVPGILSGDSVRFDCGYGMFEPTLRRILAGNVSRIKDLVQLVVGTRSHDAADDRAAAGAGNDVWKQAFLP